MPCENKEHLSKQMGVDEERLLKILRNQGFTDPQEWQLYASEHNFKKVNSIELPSCPDCGSSLRKKIGHYVYYSTFINLQLCQNCKLAYAGRRIDAEITQKHFEVAYKDEGYFQNARRDIFNQTVELISMVAPASGKVLDIGAAKGHMMGILKRNRPDLDITINDISKRACDSAKSIYNLKTICAPISSLQKVETRFDIVVLIDVIYYEMEIKKLWELLGQLLKKNGWIIIRNPNKHSLIRYYQSLTRFLSLQKKNSNVDKISFFNPEHIYLFSKKYFHRRLKRLGCSHVRFTPSKLLLHDGYKKGLCSAFYSVAKLIHILSFGKIVITPSFVIMARLSK